MNGEEFKQWLRDGAPLPDPEPKFDPRKLETTFAKVGHFDAELLGDFPLRDDAGDDVIATMTPNGLEIEVVERVPVGMRDKDRRRAVRKFKISREKLANMTKPEAEECFGKWASAKKWQENLSERGSLLRTCRKARFEGDGRRP